MKHGTRRNGALLAAATALCAMTSPKPAESLTINRLGLFSEEADSGRIEELEPYAVIPYRVGTSCYGWVLYFEPVDGTVELDEILRLPAPATEWNDDVGGSIIADDGQSARTHLEFEGQSGVATNAWCVADGDPEGQYVFTLFFQRKQVGQLPFRLRRE